MNKLKKENLNLDFINEESINNSRPKDFFQILISDDDEEIHVITKMMLKNFIFLGKGVKFLDAYNAEETIKILKRNKNIAIVFLDVVMEENHSGLEVVKYIRENLKNNLVRIILRTGQPGEAPEETVIRDYDINDYLLKTEMTMKKIYTVMYVALRNYRDLFEIDKHKKGLEKIIQSSSDIFKYNSVEGFLNNVLLQLSQFYDEENDNMISDGDSGGFIVLNQNKKSIIMTATGKYSSYIGKEISKLEEFDEILKELKNSKSEVIIKTKKGFLIKNSGNNYFESYIYIDNAKTKYDFELIKLFLNNYSVALDNYILENTILSTQNELIIMLGEVIEKHFEETAGHVRRISEMIYRFSQKLNFSHSESELLKVASTMHDIGKIGIPDAILKKRGRLTLEEFEQIQEHSIIGYKLLSKSKLEILKLSAEIALNHHEKFNGSGYPNGLIGHTIPYSARILAILDVFDAMTHKRVYKDACSKEEALEYIINQSGIHFDPELVKVFIQELEYIIGKQ